MALPGRASTAWPPQPYPPEIRRAIADALADVYEQARQAIMGELLEADLTPWGVAFRRQHLSQIQAVLDRAGQATEEWARYSLRHLYLHGLEVVDGYLMQPELAEFYRQARAAGMGHLEAVTDVGARVGIRPGGLSVAAHPGQITPMDLGFTRLHEDAIGVLVQNTVTRLGDARAYCGQWVEIMLQRSAGLRNIPAELAAQSISPRTAAWFGELRIRSSTLRAMAEAYARAETPHQAARRFREHLLRNGIMQFTDRAGRVWDSTEYTRMVATTVCMEAENHGLENRMIESGNDVVRVSDHPRECPRCTPWEGRLLSITGQTEGMPTVDHARAAGLWHPRCGHAMIPYIRGREILRRAAA